MRAVGVVCRVVENVGTVGVPDGGDEEIEGAVVAFLHEIGRHLVTSDLYLQSSTRYFPSAIFYPLLFRGLTARAC